MKSKKADVNASCSLTVIPANPTKHSLIPLLAALLLLGLLQQAGAQVTLLLSNKWSLAQGSRYYLPNGGDPRGVGMNPLTGHILIPSIQGGSNHVAVLDANGNDLGSLSGAGVTGGTKAICLVGASDDGVIYGCNLATSGQGFIVYRWPGEDVTGATPPLALALGTPFGATGGRLGDSFAVRGAGNNTQFIVSGTGMTNFAIFTTTDGTNFTATVFNLPSPLGAGQAERGLCFDSTNSAFYASKESGPAVHYISFNLSAATATLVGDINAGQAWAGPTVAYFHPFVTNTVRVLAGVYDDGGSGPGVHQLQVYDISNTNAPVVATNSPFPTPVGSNGNETGGTAMGNGMIVGFDTANGLQALGMSFQAHLPASIQTPPVGVTGVFPTYNLTVVASGTLPLSYQWLASSAHTNTASTFTNIPGATDTAYAVTYAATNYFEVVVTNAFGAVTSTPVLVSLLTPVNSTVVTQLWRVPAGANGYAYLSPTDNATRGIGYDANSNRVVVSSFSGGTAIYILDGSTGTNLGTLDLTGANLGGGTFQLDQVVVADDGAVYSGNLALPNQIFNLNRWPAPTTNATAANAYSDAGTLGTSSDRWGDTMAVRGAGTGTQILLGSRNGTNVALLTTGDGVNFTASLIAISNVTPGFAANGIAFGDGNTLWGKAFQGHLFKVAFDPIGLTGGKVLDFPNPAQTPTSMVGVGVDPVHSILAGIDLADTPHDLKLFQLPGTADPPVLFDQAYFASANANGNDNVAIAMKYPRVYALDVNNGIIALSYGVPPTTPPVINTPPADQTVYTNTPAATLSVGASGSLPLYYQWRYYGNGANNLPANILNATNSTYVLNYPPVSASGYYDVVVHNVAGNATSAPPTLLTIIEPATSTVVTQLWTLAAGSRPYLDGSSYNTRGLAYDTNSGTVLVCDHQNIYVLAATNGSDLFQLNTLGLPAGGNAGWLLDQIGVADDGVVYGANLTLDGTAFAITSWSSVSAGASLNSAWGGTAGADPTGGTGDRCGDTMAVRGAGATTEILIGSYSGTHVVLFTTTDGLNFTANPIAVTNVPAGFSGQGVAFGSGDTFWTKSPGFLLRQVAFERTAWQGGAVQTFTTMPSAFDGIGVDVAAGVLGGVNFSDTPNDLQLYLLSGNATLPALFDQAFFGSVNINSQLNAATALKAGKAFGLDVNNGLVAVSYGVPTAPPVTITSVSYHAGTGVTINWNNCFNGHKYQVVYKNALTNGTWTSVGAPTTAVGPTASFTDASPLSAAHYYRVQSE